MSSNEVIALIVTGLTGSGLIVFGITQLLKSGETYLDRSQGSFLYNNINGEFFIKKFKVSLHFINKSGHQRIIRIEDCKYYDLATLHTLYLENGVVQPNYAIRPKDVISFDFSLVTYHTIQAPIPVLYENAYLEVAYSINGKTSILTIMATDLAANPDGTGFFRAAQY